MTKASPARLARKGKAPRVAPVQKRYALTEQELMELRTLNTIATAERFKAEQAKANTALITGGQQFAVQLDGLARIMENYRNNWMAAKFTECGFPPGFLLSVDLKSGKLTPVKK